MCGTRLKTQCRDDLDVASQTGVRHRPRDQPGLCLDYLKSLFNKLNLEDPLGKTHGLPANQTKLAQYV
jgi:hypothetical protein